MSVANNIKCKLPKTESAKEFMNFETRLKNQGTHYIYFINNQGARKKTGRRDGKGK
ncbi:hypothetical protein ACOSQ2_013681 [Xanthoceras sorbifolium]